MFHAKNILNRMMSAGPLASIGFAAFLCGGSPALASIGVGTAEAFGVLGGSTVTNTGNSVITGDLGVWPGLAITGFPPGIVSGTTHKGDAVALQAQSDVTTAYNAFAGLACNTDLTGQDLGGLTLTPKVYCFSSSAQLTGTLTLSGAGVYVFQIGSTLTTASNSKIVLTNGATACGVWWQVGSSATLGSTTAFKGSILALTSITLNTGASMTGRALARNGAVTLQDNAVDVSPCATVCPAITLSPATLPTGVVGVAYLQTITATGGTGPYTFAVTAGSLPTPASPAFALTSGGALSGTPTAASTSSFTITATDANGCKGSQPYTITINLANCPTLTILPATLPIAVVGLPFSQTISASGGTGFTFASAPVPPVPGLTLTSAGLLSGTPTTTGSFSFTVTATDANGCTVSQAYTILVNPFVPEDVQSAPVPTLSRWAMIMFAALLALSGFAAIRWLAT